MKDYAVPFAIGLALTGLGFFAMDWALMNAQGLTLFFGG
jgi:hypothetical protein